MNDLEFMREAQRRMREGTVPRVEVIREAERLLPKEERHNNMEKVRLFMEIQSVGKRVLKLVGHDIPIVTESTS